jgi:hypothetical protein
LKFFRFDHFGTAGAFGLPIAMLAIDIILRVLMIEKRSAIVDSAQETESSIASVADEETPLLGSQSHSSEPSLAIRNFFDARLMTAVLVEVTISSIFSALETVGQIAKYNLNKSNMTSSDFALVYYRNLPMESDECGTRVPRVDSPWLLQHSSGQIHQKSRLGSSQNCCHRAYTFLASYGRT